jgi:hypothetical protein
MNGLTQFETQILGQYNSERNRGLLHTPAWMEEMADLQRRFDEDHPLRRHDDCGCIGPTHLRKCPKWVLPY